MTLSIHYVEKPLREEACRVMRERAAAGQFTVDELFRLITPIAGPASFAVARAFIEKRRKAKEIELIGRKKGPLCKWQEVRS